MNGRQYDELIKMSRKEMVPMVTPWGVIKSLIVLFIVALIMGVCVGIIALTAKFIWGLI